MEGAGEKGRIDSWLTVGVPRFQFYADLPPALTSHEVLSVTDDQTVLSRNRETGVWYLRTKHKFEEVGAENSLIRITDSGFALIDDRTNPDHRRVINTRTRKTVSLVHSPILTPRIEDVNEAGWIGGFVVAGSGTYGRIWDKDGVENVAMTAAGSRVEHVEPFGTTWSVGFVGDQATLWKRNQGTPLLNPSSERVALAGVSGSGAVAGAIGTQAAVWDAGGTFLFHGRDLRGSSRALAIMEDNSYLVEILGDGEKSYRIGRGGQTVAFESSSLKSIEDFPIVSVDGVSPSGVMVATIMETISGQKARVLVGPEAFRSDSRTG